MKVSVCIPSVRPTHVQTAIDSIRRQTFTDWELIVVGQGDDPRLPGIGARAAREDARVRYLHLDKRGLSLARNAGAEHARGEIVAMTDDDCEAAPDWLETLVRCLDEDPSVGLVGGALVAPPTRRRTIAMCPAFWPAEALYDPKRTPTVPPAGFGWLGANFALRRPVLDLVGPFDAYLGAGGLFPAAEDTDYAIRIERHGIRMRSTPTAVVHHTYGHRYGLAALAKNSAAYARGNGALAGKLSLLGDPRGPWWLRITVRQSIGSVLRPHRTAVGLVRLSHYLRAYRRCMRDFTIGSEWPILVPRRPART